MVDFGEAILPGRPSGTPDSPLNGFTSSIGGQHSRNGVDRASLSHTEQTTRMIATLGRILESDAVTIDGEHLYIPSLVAVAKHGICPGMDPSQELSDRIQASVDMLRRHLDRGDTIYGVNTGYGGSADTRSDDLENTQRALLQHQQCGVLFPADLRSPGVLGNVESHAMPTEWVKGTILARVNTIIRGHSAVSRPIINALLDLLRHDLTPIVPLRGSISASGDLSPLSYIAGVLEGNPELYVRTGRTMGYAVIDAPAALKLMKTEPITLGAKEGLGLLNGTSFSASVGSLAVYNANSLALITQALTAMAVEALRGTAESFHPFVASVRPHRGQRDAASNIFSFLQGSDLVRDVMHAKDPSLPDLYQDRYALRTAAQWIGPVLEDFQLATEQVSIELNATTDNPLTDVANDIIHHQGNFQAFSITSAMEKTRLGLQALGKLLFAQTSELINPSLSNGLPANLAPDDPSLSFTAKGLDIAMASYYSELAYLSGPVSSHVQVAEMCNQSLNSLALISARYTMEACSLLSIMTASHLWLVCQALDLRALNFRFAEELQRIVLPGFVREHFPTAAQEAIAPMYEALLSTFNSPACTTLDLRPRASKAAREAIFSLSSSARSLTAEQMAHYTSDLAARVEGAFVQWRTGIALDYLEYTPPHLGRAAKALYRFVRSDLKVPFFEGRMAHPRFGQPAHSGRRSIGGWVSVLCEAVKDGRVAEVVAKVVAEGRE